MLPALLIACARLAPEPEGGTGFPHPSDYAEQGHGADSLAQDAPCWTCHATRDGDLVGGVLPAAPSCTSCHAIYPHDDAFRSGNTHGLAWLDDSTECSDCHGESGGLAPADRQEARCWSCHSSYPHLEGWKEPENHGAAVRAHGSQVACASCHDAEGPADAACASCHPLFPHVEGWADPALHSVAWVDDPTSCTDSCHPADGADGRVACASCHDLYPHAEGWAPRGHIQVVQNRGERVCSNCHDAGELGAPVLPVSCAAGCHEEAP